MAVYGGDEVSALVLDTGSQWTKAGFAGEDTPKYVIPTDLGAVEDNTPGADTAAAMDVDGGGAAGAARRRKFYIGDNAVALRRDHMEMTNPLKDGLIHDWDAVEQLWSYTFGECLRTSPAEHPLLIAEPSFNTRDNREKTAEIIFEKYNVPALFICKNAVLSAYSCGRPSALVVDAGAAMTSVTPVFDGYVIRNGIVKQTLAGNALTQLTLNMLEQQLGVKVNPSYTVAEKRASEPGKPSPTKLRDLGKSTSSFLDYQKLHVAADFKETVCGVSHPHALDDAEERLVVQPKRPYEFPDGYNSLFGIERLRIGEALFHPAKYYTLPRVSTDNYISLHEMIHHSLKLCDSELWQPLLASTVLTGGTSLMPGLPERVHSEVSQLAASLKAKVIASPSSIERRFSSWIGGSILASLGSFHQMWVAKAEYDETGRPVIEQKCS